MCTGSVVVNTGETEPGCVVSGWVCACVRPGAAHKEGDWGRQKGHEALNLAESWGKNIPGRGHSRSRGLRQEAAHSVQGRGAMRLELGECGKALVTEVEQGGHLCSRGKDVLSAISVTCFHLMGTINLFFCSYYYYCCYC